VKSPLIDVGRGYLSLAKEDKKGIWGFLWRVIVMDLLDACPYCDRWHSRNRLGRLDYCTELVECKYCHRRYKEDIAGY